MQMYPVQRTAALSSAKDVSTIMKKTQTWRLFQVPIKSECYQRLNKENAMMFTASKILCLAFGAAVSNDEKMKTMRRSELETENSLEILQSLRVFKGTSLTVLDAFKGKLKRWAMSMFKDVWYINRFDGAFFVGSRVFFFVRNKCCVDFNSEGKSPVRNEFTILGFP